MTNEDRNRGGPPRPASSVDAPAWAATSVRSAMGDVRYSARKHMSALEWVCLSIDTPDRPLRSVDVIKVTPEDAAQALAGLRGEGWTTTDFLAWAAEGRLPVNPVYIDFAGDAQTACRVEFEGGTAVVRGAVIRTSEYVNESGPMHELQLCPLGSEIAWQTPAALVRATNPMHVARWATSPAAWNGRPMPKFAPVGVLAVSLAERKIRTGTDCNPYADDPRSGRTYELAGYPLYKLGIRSSGAATLGYRSLDELLTRFGRDQVCEAMAISSRILVAQSELVIAALRLLTTTDLEVFEAPVGTGHTKASSRPASGTSGRVLRIGPGRTYRDPGHPESAPNSGAPVTKRRAHWHHVTRGKHVWCETCRGAGHFEAGQCPDCRGSGRNAKRISPCRRRDPRTGALTCPDGCRAEWVSEIKDKAEGPTVRVHMASRAQPHPE